MDPDELCHCGDERKWHDPCSRCDCPWFLAPDNEGARGRWETDRKARARADRRLAKAARP